MAMREPVTPTPISFLQENNFQQFGSDHQKDYLSAWAPINTLSTEQKGLVLLTDIITRYRI